MFGLALSVASTVVLTRVLADNRRPAHAGRAHRRRLAGRRGPVHRARAGAPAGRVRPARGAGPAQLAVAVGLAVVKIAALVAVTFLVGGRVIPWLLERVAADPLARAVHPDGAGGGARHRGRVGRAVRGVDGPGRVPGRAWWSAGPTSACGRRPTRCRCATPSPCCSSSRSGCCSTPASWSRRRGWSSPRSPSSLLGKPLAALAHRAASLGHPLRVGAARWPSRWPRSASSRSSWPRWASSSGSCRTTAMHALVAAAIVSITLNPLLYRLVGPLERLGCPPPAAAAPARRPRRPEPAATAGPAAEADPRLPGGGGRVRAGRPDGLPAAAGERDRADGDRDEPGDGPATPRARASRRCTATPPSRTRSKEAGVATAGSLILSASGMHRGGGGDPPGPAS